MNMYNFKISMSLRSFSLLGMLILIQLDLISQTAVVTNFKEMIIDREKTSVSLEIIDSNMDINLSKPILVGSGFVIIRNHIQYIITNSHIYRDVPKGKSLISGVNTNNGKIYMVIEFVKECSDKDIAVFKYSGDIINASNLTPSLKIDQKNIGISQFAQDSEIQKGTTIFTLGYPLGIGSDTFGNSPVYRNGVVAQGVDGNGFFIIDGISNPGNSGSPVFNSENGIFIGMISSYINDTINGFDRMGNPIISLPYNSGLTNCISAQEIRNLIP
jgi:S1-C subfamily serine protease